MARTVAIGEQDFSRIIENRYFYIDKTDFIREWWENGDTVTLINRPRRFGKTLTMRMTEQFFSAEYAGSALFESLSIWKEQKYRKLQGTYPVIYLSFADVKSDQYEETYYHIRRLIAREYRRYVSLLESDKFQQVDRDQFYKIMSGNANVVDICSSLNQLSEYLYTYYGKKTIILLDEYDTPMQEAYISGYWSELAAFMRKLFNSTFKTNPFLERGMMTGITRVSKESVFSDLNNLTVVTTTTKLYETAFGFTESEVFAALEEYGLQGMRDEVKRWYDGFCFGDCDHIYNPWSVTQFLKFKELGPHWANTSSNKLIGKLIQQSSPEIKTAVEDLLQGKEVCTAMDEQIVFDQLDESEEAVWSFLLASGYLKISGYVMENDIFGLAGIKYKLTLTNLEIVSIFKKMIHGWFAGNKYGYHDFLKALLLNDIRNMNVYMNRVALTTISFFDAGSKPSAQAEPEKFYHGLVLGIMLSFGDRYLMVSNRESGFGRYDILLEPRFGSDDGIIFEFKVIDPDTEKNLQDTVKAALKQIIEKKYAATLEDKGLSRGRIRIYGFAFRGKEVLIDGGYLNEFV